MIHLDLRSSQPLYEQIISQYKYLYLQGFLKKGDAIPSVRKLALELDVTPGNGGESLPGNGTVRHDRNHPWKGYFYGRYTVHGKK